MAVPADKAALLAAMRDEYRRLRAVLARVPPERTFIQELDGHAKNSQMSAADLLAYLLGWQALVLKWHRLEREGLPIDFPDTGYRWNQLGLLAQKFYRDYQESETGRGYARCWTTVNAKWRRWWRATPTRRCTAGPGTTNGRAGG